jgi:hypothetical protein
MAPRAPLLIAIVLVAALSGCAPAPEPAAPATPRPASPQAPDPVTVCVNQLTHWAGEDLRAPDALGYDYQHRGLTAQQADALRAIVGEAQSLGPDRAAEVVPERIRTACTAIAGATP